MNSEQLTMVMRDSLYSLVSLGEFKSVLGFDDRDDKLGLTVPVTFSASQIKLISK